MRVRISERELKARISKMKRAARSAPKDIDYSDIPELSNEQLKKARRVGRPLLGKAPRKLISIKIDPFLLANLKKLAQKQDQGYQTLIHQALEEFIRKAAA